MTQQTMVLDAHTAAQPHNHTDGHNRPQPGAPDTEPLLREALGSTLREFRTQTGFSLRQLSSLANVSPGYLSELERGRKEVSSELLASVCHAMNVSVASVMIEAASMMALDSAAAELAAGMATRVNV